MESQRALVVGRKRGEEFEDDNRLLITKNYQLRTYKKEI